MGKTSNEVMKKWKKARDLMIEMHNLRVMMGSLKSEADDKLLYDFYKYSKSNKFNNFEWTNIAKYISTKNVDNAQRGKKTIPVYGTQGSNGLFLLNKNWNGFDVKATGPFQNPKPSKHNTFTYGNGNKLFNATKTMKAINNKTKVSSMKLKK